MTFHATIGFGRHNVFSQCSGLADKHHCLGDFGLQGLSDKYYHNSEIPLRKLEVQLTMMQTEVTELGSHTNCLQSRNVFILNACLFNYVRFNDVSAATTHLDIVSGDTGANKIIILSKCRLVHSCLLSLYQCIIKYLTFEGV